MDELKIIEILRLKSGEELIGRVLNTDDGITHIQDACILLPTPDKRLTFAKWMDYTAEGSLGGTMKIPNDFVAFRATPGQKLIETYTRALHSAYSDIGGAKAEASNSGLVV